VEIDSSGVAAKYRQLRQNLLELISTELGPDSPIPSERQLGETYGMSRMTVRHAIDQLVAEGRLYRVRARGTFVARPETDARIRLESFTEETVRRGMVPASRILSFERIEAGPALARRLEIRPGDGVVRLVRLRYADSTPMAFERCHLPERRVPGILGIGSPKSLYAVLAEEYGLTLNRGEQVVEARHADPEEAALLELPATGVVLQATRRCYSDDVLVDYAGSVYRADRHRFSMPLSRPTHPT
jgi:GntR family transcriptional regulator